ncbi:MAG: hypothetical protein ACFFDP_11450, partial [Promethearchaeota archaeon]
MEFIDLHFLSNQYYQLKPDFIQKLQSLIQRKANYSKRDSSIRSVRGPKKRILAKPFLLFLSTIMGLMVTLLGELSDDNSAIILGVYPSQFKRILELDTNAIINIL